MKPSILAASLLLFLSAPSQAELVAHWSFDGTLAESSGNGYDAFDATNDLGDTTFSSDVSAALPNSQSVSFNENSYLATPLSWEEADITDAFTVSAWAKYDGDEDAFILDFDRSENFSFLMYRGQYYFAMTDSNGTTYDYIYGNTFNGGEWNHLFVSYGATNGLQFYANGELIFSDIYRGSVGKNEIDRYATIGDGSEAFTPDSGHHKSYSNLKVSELALWNEEYTQSFYVANALHNGEADVSALLDVPAPFALAPLSLLLLGASRRQQTLV